jgi:hypothetical protein
MIRSVDEVRKIIESFLNDTDEPTDWDDFISIPIKDQYLDAVRRVCLFLPLHFPPDPRSGEYCNGSGRALLQTIVARFLRS